MDGHAAEPRAHQSFRLINWMLFVCECMQVAGGISVEDGGGEGFCSVRLVASFLNVYEERLPHPCTMYSMHVLSAAGGGYSSANTA